MILIAGVLVMAIGAWYMPWYQGQLGLGALQGVSDNLSDTKTAVDDVKKDLSGDGLTGKQDLVSLLSAGTDEDDLKSILLEGIVPSSDEMMKYIQRKWENRYI